MIEKYGWKRAIVILCVVTMLLAVLGISLIFRHQCPELLKENENKKNLISEEEFKTGTGMRFIICCFCMLGGSVCLQLVNYISMYAESIGYSLTISALLMTFVMIGNIIGKLILGIVCDLTGVWKSMTAGTICVCIGALGMIFARKCLAALCLSALLFGFTYATATLTVSKCSLSAYGKAKGERFSGIHTSVNSAIAAASSMGAGVLFDATGNFTKVFFLSSIVCIMSIVAIYIMEGRIVEDKAL